MTDNGDGTASVSCPGSETVIISDGKDGTNGKNGTNGEDGADGADGKNGADGANGTSGRIAAIHFCTGLLEGTDIHFVYEAIMTQYRDVFAYGAVRNARQEIGASAFYAAMQAGAITAKVVFTYDQVGASNGGWWDLSLNRGTMTTTIVYNDPDATGGQIVWNMLSTACTSHTY